MVRSCVEITIAILSGQPAHNYLSSLWPQEQRGKIELTVLPFSCSLTYLSQLQRVQSTNDRPEINSRYTLRVSIQDQQTDQYEVLKPIWGALHSPLMWEIWGALHFCGKVRTAEQFSGLGPNLSIGVNRPKLLVMRVKIVSLGFCSGEPVQCYVAWQRTTSTSHIPPHQTCFDFYWIWLSLPFPRRMPVLHWLVLCHLLGFPGLTFVLPQWPHTALKPA